MCTMLPTRVVGASYSVASCDLRILMDQPTESISPGDGPSRQDDSGFDRPEWWHLSQGTMWTVNVVVIGVLSQHGLQLSASEDEHPVQHLTPNGADPSLRVGIRPWRPHRRAQHLDPFSGKDRIERRGEPRIPIADQKPEPADAIASSMSRFRACWVTHAPAACGVTPSTWTRRVAISITNSTYSRFRNTVSTVKKSTASTPLAWARRNCRHETIDRLGAGSTPTRCRMHHTVLAPIL